MPSSQLREPRRKNAIAILVAAVAALGLAAFVWWHVDDLSARTRATSERGLSSAVARLSGLIDMWIDERKAESTALAEIAGIHGTDSVALDPRIAGRILHYQMTSLVNRGAYQAIWMVGASGHVHGAVGNQDMSPAELSAARKAIASGKSVVSHPEQHDSLVTVAIATPIWVMDKGARQVGAVAVLRTSLTRAMVATAMPRIPANAMGVLVATVGDSLVGAHLCHPGGSPLCLGTDTILGRRALRDSVFTGTIASASGEPMLLSTHRIRNAPWAIYYAVPESAVYAPMRDGLRTDLGILLAIVLVVLLGLYAYDRSMQFRRVAEQAQTEARFATIVNTAMDAIIIVDREFNITEINVAAEAMFRLAAGTAPGRSVLDLAPDGTRDDVRRALDHTVQTGEQPRLFRSGRHTAGRRTDGSVFPVDIGISRFFLEGAPYLTIVMRDVSAWKRAEESAEWQRRVLEAIATGVELRDVLRTIARFHETQCPGAECGIHLVDDDVTLRLVAAPSMRPEFVDAMDELIIGPTAATCGAAVYRHEQVITTDLATDPLWRDYRALALEQGYAASWATPLRSPTGRILGGIALYLREPRAPTPAELRITAMAVQLAGVAVDRAHAAESLRQSEASFRSFVENSPIGIYRATGTGRLLAVNASLIKLLGYASAADLLQVSMTDGLFASLADRDRLGRQLQASGEVSGADVEWRRKDGSLVTVRVSARAYRDERGSVWFSEGFVENVTPLRAAEHALRQSEKLAAVGQLVSGVAHELNNPLAAILHFTEDLLEDDRSPQDAEALSVIRDQARRSRAIVRDLLSFVRFRESGREIVSVQEVLSATLRALEPSIADAGAGLVTDLPAADVQATVDRAALQQIVTNLVVNAAQASGKDGQVRLRARVNATELLLVVEDSGPGIPPKLMHRIFEPFFTTKPVGQGTGLGLSVTLGIVQQLGGRIVAENRPTNEGTGARFVVRIPMTDQPLAPQRELTPPHAQPVVPQRPTREPTTGPRVLIIDDEAPIRAALTRFFRRRGWQVEEAEDGSEALTMMLDGHGDYAAIISDLRMPGCSGMELHDHVAAVAPELLDRIIFSTGDVASRDAAEFMERTNCLVMQKPFELQALEAVVGKMREATLL